MNEYYESFGSASCIGYGVFVDDLCLALVATTIYNCEYYRVFHIDVLLEIHQTNIPIVSIRHFTA